MSGKSVHVSLPAVVSMIAVGPADKVAAGVAAAAAAGFLAGVAFAAGAVCDQPAKHMAEISKQIEKQIRMDALLMDTPGPVFARPGG